MTGILYKGFCAFEGILCDSYLSSPTPRDITIIAGIVVLILRQLISTIWKRTSPLQLSARILKRLGKIIGKLLSAIQATLRFGLSYWLPEPTDTEHDKDPDYFVHITCDYDGIFEFSYWRPFESKSEPIGPFKTEQEVWMGITKAFGKHDITSNPHLGIFGIRIIEQK